MSDQRDYSTVFTVDQSPEEVFGAINNVDGWWEGDNEGNTTKVGDEFVHTYQNDHYCKLKIAELIPEKKVAWHVLENRFSFTADQSEWTGTDIVFEIAKTGDKTKVTFTHIGLAPQLECYEICSGAWDGLMAGNLRNLIVASPEEE